VEFRVQASTDLGRLSKQLKDAGSKDAQKHLRKRLREAVKPVVADVKAASPSRTIDRAVAARFSYSEKSAAARIVVAQARLPEGKKRLGHLLEFGSAGSGGRYIRHPVFGSEVRVSQPIRPYFYRTIEGKRDDVQQVVARVLDDVARDAGFK
jgi:hypothetical protein